MIKSFLILISFSTFLFSSQQIVLVVADDFNTSKAKLECFEDGNIIHKSIDVNIGKKGLGWGLGEIKLSQRKNDPIKVEGDKKAPIGVFKLSKVFGYSKNNNLSIPYIHTSKNLICVDDSNSKKYNKIISMPKEKPKSFEFMKRDDLQYKLGVVVEHNKNAEFKRGSCIFIHVQKKKNAGTAGCTSMKLEKLKKIVTWLDKKKNPILIQIPKSLSNEILKLYPELTSSRLLKNHTNLERN
ncbi:MAG: hypothetical protein ACI9TV_000112 [Sulfurimonas sp.]|jgi:hypothetical protein|uniref:L,D-transpeptidase family protein n=1 Tax=Sulfurimonas sp. TaxID=2022749 RepID=UPI0039E4958E